MSKTQNVLVEKKNNLDNFSHTIRYKEIDLEISKIIFSLNNCSAY